MRDIDSRYSMAPAFQAAIMGNRGAPWYFAGIAVRQFKKRPT
jgi:hypothetical protein